MKQLPDNDRLRIMWQVAVTSAIEGQGEAYVIYAGLLHDYLSDKNYPWDLHNETKNQSHSGPSY